MTRHNRISAGERNQLLIFLGEQETENDSGDRTVATIEVARAWGKAQPVRGSEEERYGELRDVRVVLFTFPRIDSLSATWRIRWNGREHNIDEIRDTGVPGEDMIVKGISGVAQ